MSLEASKNYRSQTTVKTCGIVFITLSIDLCNNGDQWFSTFSDWPSDHLLVIDQFCRTPNQFTS